MTIERKARIRVAGVDRAANEETAGGDERQRHRKLTDDQQPSGRQPAHSPNHARFAFQIRSQRRTRERPRWSEREADRAEGGEPNGGDNDAIRRIDHELEPKRQDAAKPRHQPARRPASQRDARGGAKRREYKTLREQLLDDAQASAAERLANRNF